MNPQERIEAAIAHIDLRTKRITRVLESSTDRHLQTELATARAALEAVRAVLCGR